MITSYLDTALDFTTRNELNELDEKREQQVEHSEYEKNERNEERVNAPGLTSSNSFISYSPQVIHDAKVAMLLGMSHDGTAAWRGAILVGIRYAQEGRVIAEVIQEDIEVWRELATDYDWPPAPHDLCSYEENEFNVLRGAA